MIKQLTLLVIISLSLSAQADNSTSNSANRPSARSSQVSDGFPAAPAKRPGVTSCNTRCVNAACWRTYDDGRKVRVNAKQVYDPFSNQWKFDAGSC